MALGDLGDDVGRAAFDLLATLPCPLRSRDAEEGVAVGARWRFGLGIVDMFCWMRFRGSSGVIRAGRKDCDSVINKSVTLIKSRYRVP